MGAKVIKTSGELSLDDLIKRSSTISKYGKVAKIGWLTKSAYPPYKSKKTGKSGKTLTVAQNAMIHELGSPERNIPPRPMLRPTAKRDRSKWIAIMAAEIKRVLRGETQIESSLETVGQVAAGGVKRTISQLKSPALKQRTIDARRRQMADKATTGNLTKPLVFTKLLFNSVTNSVEKE